MLTKTWGAAASLAFLAFPICPATLGDGPATGGTEVTLADPILAADVAAGDGGLSALVTQTGDLMVWGAQSPGSTASLPVPVRADTGVHGTIGDIASWDGAMFMWVREGPAYWWETYSPPNASTPTAKVDAQLLGDVGMPGDNWVECHEDGEVDCTFDEDIGRNWTTGIIHRGMDGIPHGDVWGTLMTPLMQTPDGTSMKEIVGGGAGWIGLDPSGKIWEAVSGDQYEMNLNVVSWTTYGDEDARFKEIYGQPGIGFGITVDGVVWSWATPPWRGGRLLDSSSGSSWQPASPMLLGRPGFTAEPDASLNEIMAPVDTSGTPMEGARIEHLSVSEDHVLALAEDGRVFAWGRNHLGQLGNPSVGPEGTTSPVEVGLLPGATVLFGSTPTTTIATQAGTGALTPEGPPGTVEVAVQWDGRTFPVGEFTYLEVEEDAQDAPSDRAPQSPSDAAANTEPTDGLGRATIVYVLLAVAAVAGVGALVAGVIALRSKL